MLLVDLGVEVGRRRRVEVLVEELLFLVTVLLLEVMEVVLLRVLLLVVCRLQLQLHLLQFRLRLRLILAARHLLLTHPARIRLGPVLALVADRLALDRLVLTRLALDHRILVRRTPALLVVIHPALDHRVAHPQGIRLAVKVPVEEARAAEVPVLQAKSRSRLQIRFLEGSRSRICAMI